MVMGRVPQARFSCSCSCLHSMEGYMPRHEVVTATALRACITAALSCQPS